MRRSDFVAMAVSGAVVLALLGIPGAMDGFIAFTKQYPYFSSFLKFAILPTFGECIGLRISTGVYNKPGFGILPRAVVWGFLGMGIKMAFTIFAVGAPTALAEMGLPISAATLKGSEFGLKLIASFGISLSMNLMFAPVFMTLHKVTDAHISATGGTLRGFFSRIDFVRHLQSINWSVMWGFVFKKTIPMFWVPAHTITFLLPGHFQVIFAAALGVVLGVILAVAALKK